MPPENSFAPELESLKGQQVVVDTKGPYICIGTLEQIDANSLSLSDVDVHNTSETTTSNDLYLIEALKHGVRINRRSAHILAKEIVSVSLLSDIVVY